MRAGSVNVTNGARPRVRRDAIAVRLYRHPAGQFFGLSAAIAVLLPWIWVVPLGDPYPLHLGLGLFGFVGAAITGFVLTSLPAWTRLRLPIGVSYLWPAFLFARLAATGVVVPVWIGSALQVGIGICVLWPAARARLWQRFVLAAAPFMLGVVEFAVEMDGIDPLTLNKMLAFMLLMVGGKIVPAFLKSEAARQGRVLGVTAFPLLAAGLAVFAMMSPSFAAVALVYPVAAILWRLAQAVHAGPANRMLAAGWGTLALTLPALVLAPEGAARVAAEHLFMIATVGGTIYAIAARPAMARQPGRLAPSRVQVAGFLMVLIAAPLRAGAALGWGQDWLVLSAVAWSAGWALFLVAHLPALLRPAPFPVLSLARAGQAAS